MHRLLKAFFFKIKRDLTFKISLIIGISFAVITVAELFTINSGKFINGQGMLLTSFSPIQSFGFVIPVNLIIFVCLEFSQGSIRNKIIAGNSKLKIYFSLVLSGLVFMLALIAAYTLICTAFGCIFGGFDLSKPVLLIGALSMDPATTSVTFLLQYSLISLLIYLGVCMMAIFLATSFRNIGPAIPIVIVVIFLGFIGTAYIVLANRNNEALITVLRIFDPFYGCFAPQVEGQAFVLSNVDFISSVACNLGWAILFFVLGCIEFTKRDVK